MAAGRGGPEGGGYVEFTSTRRRVDAVAADGPVKVGDEAVDGLRWHPSGAYEYALAGTVASSEEHSKAAAAMGASLAAPKSAEQRAAVGRLVHRGHGAFLGVVRRGAAWVWEDDGVPLPPAMRVLQATPELAYDAQRVASSESAGSEARRGRLSVSGAYYGGGHGAAPDGRLKGLWVPSKADSKQWLRLLLNSPTEVHGVAVNGGGGGDRAAVTRVRVVAEGGKGGRREEVMDTHLDPDRPEAPRWLLFSSGPVHAATVTVHPVAWTGGRIAMRAEAVVSVVDPDRSRGVAFGGAWASTAGKAAAVYQRPLGGGGGGGRLATPLRDAKRVRVSFDAPVDSVGSGGNQWRRRGAGSVGLTFRLPEPSGCPKWRPWRRPRGGGRRPAVQLLDADGRVVCETAFAAGGASRRSAPPARGAELRGVGSGDLGSGEAVTHPLASAATSSANPWPCASRAGCATARAALSSGTRPTASPPSAAGRCTAPTPGGARSAGPGGSGGLRVVRGGADRAGDLPTHVAGRRARHCVQMAAAVASVPRGRTVAVWRPGRALGVDPATRRVAGGARAQLYVSPEGEVWLRGKRQRVAA